ncbi:MAG: ABC transporter permease, partial [Dehalococcoidia bacterium]
MQRYVMRRLLNMVPVLIGLTIAVFLVMRVIPGDAASVMLDESPTAQAKEELRQKLGLDRPLHEQYFSWVSGVVRGDFGTSFWTNQPVIDEIRRTAPVTIELGLLASVIAVAVAVP